MFLLILLLACGAYGNRSFESPRFQNISIPPAPVDPPLGALDGSGPYNSKSASFADKAKKVKFYAFAIAAGELGLINAEKNMRHYLGNTGQDLTIDPGLMMDDIPDFRNSVRTLVQNSASEAYNSIVEATGSTAFSSTWNIFYATEKKSPNWYFAIGGFSYSVTGTVAKHGSLKYRVHIFDRYNWDVGKNVTIGGETIKDTELGDLHLKGLAKEYTIRGTSSVNEVPSFIQTTTIPLPDVPSGRI